MTKACRGMTLKIREWLILLWSGEGENNKEEDPNMRNLKKILALVLALMMVLSVMVFASAANLEDYADSEQVSEEYAEAVDVLSGMGILKGSEGKVYPQSYVKRAEVSTLIYRMVTGDVGDTLVYLHKNYDKFEDVKESNWFAGFVNYAANNELVKGVGDNKFNPEGYMTGYELITILLRAIGYDRNNEISGSDWKITAATLAQDVGILDGLTDTTLGDYLTREEIVHLIFNALQVKQVLYTGVNYYPHFDSIGEENFGLDSRAGADTWGRPGVEWYDSRLAANNVYAFIEEDPVKTYYTAVTECDLADDIGLSRNKQYTLYTNGEPNDTQYMVQPLDTVQKIGAEGTVTEVYEDVIVTIDTFLAKVVDVDDATYDRNDHLDDPSKITLVVYTDDTADEDDGEYVYQTNGGTDYTYDVGDMVLINAYTDNRVNANGSVTVGSIGVTGATGTTLNAATEADYLFIRGAAPAVSGTQTELLYNVSQHVVNGTTYDDAKWFELDQAGNQTTSHTWYFDGYDNLIGVTDIATQYSYGILESIQWQNPHQASGYAEGTIRYMNGETSLETIAEIDGMPLVYGDTTSDRSAGLVSTSLDDNDTEYGGVDLYRIEETSDGLVLTQVYTDSDRDGGYDQYEENELTAATIETGRAVISGTKATGAATTATRSFNVNSNTVFLVQTVSGGVKSYSVVTGYENIADYTAKATVDWVDRNNDGYADYVYVIGTPDTDTNWSMFFLTSNNVRAVPDGNGGVAYYQITGILNGVPNTTIRVNQTVLALVVPSYDGTSTTSNLNQMFGLYFDDGIAESVLGTTVNSMETYTGAISGMNGYPGYASLYQDYYAAGTGTVTYNGQVLQVGTDYYNVVDLTPTFGEWSANMSDKTIYVIHNAAYVAQAVYIVDTPDIEQGSGETPVTGYAVVPTSGNNITVALSTNDITLSNAKVVRVVNGVESNFNFGTADAVITITTESGTVLQTVDATVTGTGTGNCIINGISSTAISTLASGNYRVTITITNSTIGTLTVYNGFAGF